MASATREKLTIINAFTLGFSFHKKIRDTISQNPCSTGIYLKVGVFFYHLFIKKKKKKKEKKILESC